MDEDGGNVVVLYHKADLDGLCSAAICKYKMPKAVLAPFNYGEEIPLDLIKKDTLLYLVDISVSAEEMQMLQYEAKKVIWIDHHVSAINKLDHLKIDGLRRVGTAACELVWEYFFGVRDIPDGVHLLSRYDVWSLNEEVLNYQYGIRALNLDPNHTLDWIHNVFTTPTLAYHRKNGHIILKYLEQANAKEVKSLVYETTFEGYSAIVANKLFCDPSFFESHPKYGEADLLISYGYTGKHWTVSLYTTKEDIDVSKIAMKYGGGGHKQASGFQVNEIPQEFIRGRNEED